ncbi:TonB-dependent receptor [Fibrella aestuarina BUZ 2]|uniref:TonB-dependent receptor n=1 Tax=Fibrella aestuarina BUZ 2 TaxID=1166018 RepID=I0KBT7_9BACT|nr:TonB-dependent receptor [Fibrella aestuarina]CCH01590.1 TonB-dependent receptor [Fibrella aestuarina BUZ 2]
MKKSIRFWLACWLAMWSWCVNPVLAQGQPTVLTGRVVRAANGDPLVGASVFVKGTKRGTITDRAGRYRFILTEPVTIVARFVGLRDVEVTLLPTGKPIEQNFEMVSNETQLADVMVAANRQDEYLQKVPVAASVVGRRDLERRSIYNTMESLNNTPNLITDSWLNSQVSFSIRGLSTVFDNVGFESTVALYIDDVYFSRSFAFNQTLMDIDRVEVLRGPQGTLFGKNTIGGVIHVISEKPEMTNDGQIELNYGNYNFRQIRAKLNRQLVKNKLAIRLTSALSLRDGFVTDRTPSIEALNKTNFFGFRGSLLFTPSDRVTLTLRGNYGRDNKAENTFVYTSKPDYNPVGVPADEGLTTNQNAPVEFFRDQYGGMGKLEIKLGRNTLTAISALNSSVDSYLSDNDISAADASRWGRSQGLRTFSQELRINSPRDQKFAYVAGLYYLNERISAADTFTLNKGFLPVAARLLGAPIANANQFTSEGYTTDAVIESQSTAGFVSGALELTPKLRLSGGLRLTTETRQLAYYQRLRHQLVNGVPFNIIDLYASTIGSKASPVTRQITDLALSYDVGMDYRFTSNLMGYAKFVRGFKGAGFNTAPIKDSESGGLVFRPEYVNNYELGLKAKPTERIQVNGAIFYTDYKDKQELLDQGTRVRVANAPLTRGYGAEVEFSAMLKRFRLDVSAGYLNLKFIDFPFGTDDNGNPVNYAGNRLLKAPDVTLSVAPEYTVPLNDKLRVYLGLNINHTGKAYNDISNSELLARVPASIINGRVALVPANGKWSLAFWGKNLTNKLYIQHGWEYEFGDQVAWSRPRYYGMEVYLNFR